MIGQAQFSATSGPMVLYYPETKVQSGRGTKKLQDENRTTDNDEDFRYPIEGVGKLN